MSGKIEIGAQVVVNSGPYMLRHGQVVAAPPGLEFPIVEVSFYGASGNLCKTRRDLINTGRLASFGPLQSKADQRAAEKQRKAR